MPSTEGPVPCAVAASLCSSSNSSFYEIPLVCNVSGCHCQSFGFFYGKNNLGVVLFTSFQGGMPLGPMPATGMPYMGQASFLGMRPAAPQYTPDMQKQFAEEQQ